MAVNARLLLPYLMGQRRDGLRRVLDIDPHPWDVLALDERHETWIGDPVDPISKLHNLGSLYARLATRVAALARSGRRPVSIAGDCVSSLGMLAGLQQAGQPPERVLWLDAHGDFHTWSSTQTQYIGGMPLAMFVGRVDPGPDPRSQATRACLATIGAQAYPQRQIVLADARDLDAGEREALLDSRILHCPLGEVLQHLHPQERIYLHWDTDVIDDPARMPALKYHVQRGPSATDMAAFFAALRAYNVVAVSVSAWHAEQDADNRTAGACLEILNTLLADRNIHLPHLDVGKTARAALKGQRPCVVWFTGLSGAGKSTIANLVEKRLHGMGRHTYMLDGDNVRHGLNRDLGFTEADRTENIRRVAEVAKLMVDAGLIVLAAFISPFRADRRMARSLLANGEFVEVHVDTPLHVAEQRDSKGLYKKARRGELKNFTGIDSPYEAPESPELRLTTVDSGAEQAADQVIEHLRTVGLIA